MAKRSFFYSLVIALLPGVIRAQCDPEGVIVERQASTLINSIMGGNGSCIIGVTMGHGLTYSGDTLRLDSAYVAASTRLVVDTVADFTALRAYSGTAPVVFVRKDGIGGFFKRVTGSWSDDGGITIVGTYKFRRSAENLRMVNVKWFGAVGDSTTNDNTAIQAAVAFVKDSTNATLYFPAGKYRYTSTITFYKPLNIAIEGDGMHNTYLFPVNVSGIYVRTDSSTLLYYGDYGVKEARDFQIRNLSLMRVGSNTFNGKIYGLDLRGGFNKKLENVGVRNYFASSGTGVGSVGIRLWQPYGTDATQHTIFDNVFISSCDTGVVSRLQNTMHWRSVKIDACKKVGVALSNSLFWDGGLCQANENCGLYLKNSDPYVLSGVTIQDVHFEANAYVAPKWGGIYKPDNTDMNDLNIHDCYFSSPGNSHMLRLKRVLHGAIVNNKYSGSSTTDTISLTSVYEMQFGNDDYTRLKLIASDCYITWLGGSTSGVASEVGYTIGTAAPGANYFGAGGGIAIGSTYAASNTAPTDGAIFQGNVGIKNTSPTQPLHVTGNARITGAIYDSNNEAGTSGQVLSTTATGTDWISPASIALPDSTWAKTAGGYANKRITDPIYRNSSVRVNMSGDSAALNLKYASTQTAPIFRVQYNNGTAAFYAHVFNSSNPSLVVGGLPSVDAASANNTVFGLTAPKFTSGAGQNTFMGRNAGNACNGCYENTLLGSSAGVSITSGFQNTFIGYLAGSTNTGGYQNMFLGRRAGTTNLSGIGNVGIGSDALRLNSTGSGNVAIGLQTGDGILGSSNTLIGAAAGRLTTGSGNVFLGYAAGETQTSVSNYLIVDNSNTTTPLLAGDFSGNKAGINIAPGSLGAAWHITGTGTTSSTYNFIAEKSDGTDVLVSRDDGRVGVLVTSPQTTLDASGGADGVVLPVGTDAQRPSVNGTIRGNSDNGGVEYRVGNQWYRLVANQTPSVIEGAAAGTGATAVLFDGSNDLAGGVTLTTGTGPTTGTLFTLTFADAFYTGLAIKVTLTAADSDAAAEVTKYYVSSASTTSFVVSAGSALTASTEYKLYYQIGQ